VIDGVMRRPAGNCTICRTRPVFPASEQGTVTRLVVNFLPRSLSGLSFDELAGCRC
jgi:hypothetical protein